eukprot:CAMPEP_0178589752 /NCGR_PEP_ID=MMETSP0697-20121206/27817_1 /TAXON_ID=265572 /ORGANISM="Extubocellulus spinifer, Strain CCMP396" /LENGTH=37 /DNA_ID= /DNA_START= /DNA_END= /DNA_ORIENTATION=
MSIMGGNMKRSVARNVGGVHVGASTQETSNLSHVSIS